jgi:hypothetical protein
MLVRRGNRPAADAIRQRRLPVPGVFAEEGGAIAGKPSVLDIVVIARSVSDEAIHTSDY